MGSIYPQIFGNVSNAGPKLLEEQVLTQLRVDLHIFRPAELCVYAKSVKFGFEMLVKLNIGSIITILKYNTLLPLNELVCSVLDEPCSMLCKHIAVDLFPIWIVLL